MTVNRTLLGYLWDSLVRVIQPVLVSVETPGVGDLEVDLVQRFTSNNMSTWVSQVQNIMYIA